jgi:hypothetical protein
LKKATVSKNDGNSLNNPKKPTVFDLFAGAISTIRCKPNTPRKCATEENTLIDIRAKIEKHIKNTYLKRVDAPLGVKQSLKCWMEINDG